MGYLEDVKPGAIAGWHNYKVLPSVTGAQAVLESGWGKSKLAQPPYNNNFGIKASSDWTGRVVNMQTREVINGVSQWVYADFRAYDSLADSIEDHAAFFTNTEWRRNHYKAVIGETDYKKACWALQNAGYATDPGYATSLIRVIEQNKLYEWDQEAFSGKSSDGSSNNTSGTTSGNLQPIDKKVGGNLSDAARSAVRNIGVSVIGDSLGVGTKPYLHKLLPDSNYDVYGSRQITHSDPIYSGMESLKKMKNAGTLKNIIVVILGTNRGLERTEVEEFMMLAGESRKVIWVNTLSMVNHQYKVDEVTHWASKTFKNAFLADWLSFANAMRKTWYGSDNIHMIPEGYKKHAEFIAQAVYEASTAVFSTRKAEKSVTEYHTIKGFKLSEDGILKYTSYDTDGNKTENEVQTHYRGLATNGVDSCIYNREANNKWNIQGQTIKAKWIEQDFQADKASLPLIYEALEFMNKHKEPAMTYRINLYDMPETISIGDWGLFIDHEFNPPLYLHARVEEIVESQTNKSLNSVVISNVRELLAPEKSLVVQIQEELQKERTKLLNEWRKGEPIKLELSASNGLILDDKVTETTIAAKIYQGTKDVTEVFSDFRWERISQERELDTEFNNRLSETENTSLLKVYKQDIIGSETTFICRVYDDSGQLVGQAGVSLTIPAKGRDGKNYITYIAYANSDDGTKDFSRTETNRDYMGQYVREATKNLVLNPGPVKLTKPQGYVDIKPVVNLEYGKYYVLSFEPTFEGDGTTSWEIADGNEIHTHIGEWSANPTYIFEGVE